MALDIYTVACEAYSLGKGGRMDKAGKGHKAGKRGKGHKAGKAYTYSTCKVQVYSHRKASSCTAFRTDNWRHRNLH